ncbi:MAG: hypothetical protein F6J93_25905 [Oscillatoria sp. SIO1A7]|nr:hypothetical protein [Oscillatoria sp. SIO1A7]
MVFNARYRGRGPGRRGDSIPEIAFAHSAKIIILECFAPETHAARAIAIHIQQIANNI